MFFLYEFSPLSEKLVLWFEFHFHTTLGKKNQRPPAPLSMLALTRISFFQPRLWAKASPFGRPLRGNPLGGPFTGRGPSGALFPIAGSLWGNNNTSAVSWENASPAFTPFPPHTPWKANRGFSAMAEPVYPNLDVKVDRLARPAGNNAEKTTPLDGGLDQAPQGKTSAATSRPPPLSNEAFCIKVPRLNWESTGGRAWSFYKESFHQQFHGTYELPTWKEYALTLTGALGALAWTERFFPAEKPVGFFVACGVSTVASGLGAVTFLVLGFHWTFVLPFMVPTAAFYLLRAARTHLP